MTVELDSNYMVIVLLHHTPSFYFCQWKPIFPKPGGNQ